MFFSLGRGEWLGGGGANDARLARQAFMHPTEIRQTFVLSCKLTRTHQRCILTGSALCVRCVSLAQGQRLAGRWRTTARFRHRFDGGLLAANSTREASTELSEKDKERDQEKRESCF